MPLPGQYAHRQQLLFIFGGVRQFVPRRAQCCRFGQFGRLAGIQTAYTIRIWSPKLVGDSTSPEPTGNAILAKVESRNPSFSVKCRIGANMIWDAESAAC